MCVHYISPSRSSDSGTQMRFLWKLSPCGGYDPVTQCSSFLRSASLKLRETGSWHSPQRLTKRWCKRVNLLLLLLRLLLTQPPPLCHHRVITSSRPLSINRLACEQINPRHLIEVIDVSKELHVTRWMQRSAFPMLPSGAVGRCVHVSLSRRR